MLTEYLNHHPMYTMLTQPEGLFPPAEDRAAWQALAEKDRRQLLDMAAAYRGQAYPLRRATDFMAFVRSGSRKADENPYFMRRRKLCAAALGYCVQPNQADLDEVIDGLWLICEETSWVISAHNVNPVPGAPKASEYPLPDSEAPYIDLFAAQTAMILSLVFDLLAEPLDNTADELRRRVEREIRRRILTPFMTHDDFWWMGFIRKDLNNWTPWILSNIMLTAALWMRDRSALAALLTRTCGMIDRYIDCLPDDGGCDEGAGYWNMAGGALLDCLDMLEKVTGGRMTFWHEEKIRNILSFPAKVQLPGGWFVNFADCDARPLLSGERLQFAGERLHDARLTGMGVSLRGTLAAQLDDTPQLWRLMNMLFHPAVQAEEMLPSIDTWLPNLQLRVVQRGDLLLCCKGGHNGENHNHNDVGSFMLYAAGEPQVVDAGNMVYTAKTFSEERYTLWNVRAAYHNVPLIGGHEQQPGSAYAARDVQPLPDGLALDISAAYGEEAGVASFRRMMRLSDTSLVLEDSITLTKAQEVSWVLMLRHEPRVTPGCIRAGGICLHCDEALHARVEAIDVTDPRMARNFPGRLWRLILTSGAASSHRQTLIVEKQA